MHLIKRPSSSAEANAIIEMDKYLAQYHPLSIVLNSLVLISFEKWFYVVEFFGEYSVGVIPCNRILLESVETDETGKPVRSNCWWPPVKSVSKLVMTRVRPNTSTWRIFEVKLVKAYDSYEKARVKSIRYLSESDLNTASENDVNIYFKKRLPPKFPKRSAAGVGCSRRNQPSGSQIISLAGSSQSRLMTENAFPRHPAYQSPQG
ncbi:hypothetical protein JTE90_023231 [Oedothorax gibbosus]|uniref:Uncharacterized protein n=1 Tax=Oedothorax gibbosus TaxID=931172 RepID=A0AAV6TQ51_9ARAC|nr:hypothetical protein JTE90_023231 [Oedothorax gibbosus]